jgi:hypothetical protein
VALLPKGNYVDLAKRYRRHVIESGLFVSLKDKIAHNPIVANLIGNVSTGASVLRNPKPGGPGYDDKGPKSNYRLTTCAGDRQHPDVLPPNKEAG